MLQISGLTKVYDSGKEKVVALNRLDVTFPDRGLMVILGKSGCGKTTLINMIGGLDKPTSGSILVNGEDITRLSGSSFDAYRNTYIGVVFQEFNLIDDITVYDNIEMSLKLADKNADVNTVDEVLSMVGLSNLGYRKPGELSGGQRQRVALARTLIKKPEIILADEPTGSLDAGTGEEVFESLKKIAETKLVVIVTHNRDLAFTYGERVLEMKDGRFVSDRQRATDDANRTKELNDHLLQLSATSKLDKDSLNNILAKQETDKEIYLGISYDKDRIALAYSDVVDSFYEKSETSAYHDTGEVAVTTDRTFALSKGRLRNKDALTMARKNIKRTKKKYVLLSVLSTISMVCVIVSIILSSVNVYGIVAKSTFDRGGQKFVEVMKNNSSETRITDDDVAAVKSVFGDAPLAGVVRVECRPVFAEVTNSYYNGFYFSEFLGVVEDILPDAFGYETVNGSSAPAAASEIVISDFAAFELCRSGFVGKNAAGVTGIYYPESAEELLGCCIRFDSFSEPLKVVGVFKTNYGDYRKLGGMNRSDPDFDKFYSGFKGNYEFAYSLVFGARGLASELLSTNAKYYCNFNAGGTYVSSSNVKNPSFAYNSAFDVSCKNAPTDNNTYYSTAGEINIFPDALADDEIMIDFGLLTEMLNNYSRNKYEKNWTISDKVDKDRELLWSDELYKEFIGQTLVLNCVEQNHSASSVPHTVKIAGFYDSATLNGKNYDFVTAKNVADVVTAAFAAKYEKLIVGRGASATALESDLKTLGEMFPRDDYLRHLLSGSASARALDVSYLTSFLKVLQPIFMGAALAFLLMAFLITMIFMSQNVRFRLREIAVLRLVGAKQSDIAKIFLTESGMITLLVGAIASIIGLIVITVLNFVLSGMIFTFGLGVTLLPFNFLHVLAVFAITAVFTGVSSMIPILGVTTKKPVEAIKLGGM